MSNCLEGFWVHARQNISLPGDNCGMADRVSDTNLRFLEKPGTISGGVGKIA
jgi:hypothetical protein